MRSFARILFVALFTGLYFVTSPCLGDDVARQKLARCAEQLSIIRYSLQDIGFRPADLAELLPEMENAVKTFEQEGRSTDDRNLAVLGRLWVDEAKAIIEQAKRDGTLDKPYNLQGKTILDLSRWGESVIDDEDPKPFSPERTPLVQVVAGPPLKTTGVDDKTKQTLVETYRRSGAQGLRSQIEQILKDDPGKSIANLESTLGRSGNREIFDLFTRMAGEQFANAVGDTSPEMRKAIEQSFSPQAARKRAEDFRTRELALKRLEAEILSREDLKLSPIAPGSVEAFLMDPMARFSPKEAFDPHIDRFPAPMQKIVDDFLAGEGKDFPESFEQEFNRKPSKRDIIAEMVRNESQRKQLTQAAYEHLNTQSDQMNKLLADTVSGSFILKHDIVFIGAGLHEQTMQNYLTQNNPKLTTITFERNKIPGSTFAVGGKAFNLNSSSKAEDPSGLRQRLGEADLNFLPGGPVQVNQFSQERNPPAEYFGQSIGTNRAFSPNPIAFGHEVVRVEKFPRDAQGYQYRVIRDDGSYSLAKAVVQTGIGVPVVPAIPGLREAYASQPKPAPGQPPRIMTYPEFMAFVNSTPKPLTPFSGKKVAIIGPGDSGKAVARWLLKLSNPNSYGRDTARVAGPSSIPWYGQPCNDCSQFIDQNRAFYADLVGGFKSGRLVPKEKMNALSDNGQTFTLGAAKSDIAGRSSSEEADFVVITTGFDNPIKSIYSSLVPDSAQQLNSNEFMNDSPNTKTIQGYEPSLGAVSFGRQLVNKDGQPEDIYFVGPLAGRIIDPRETKEIDENSVANANHNWRAWRTIEALSLRLQAQNQKQKPD